MLGSIQCEDSFLFDNKRYGKKKKKDLTTNTSKGDILFTVHRQ